MLDFVKKTIAGISRFLYRSRRILLSITIVILIAIVLNSLPVSWLSGDGNKVADSQFNRDTQTNDSNSTVSTTGALNVKGLEVYGGDLKSHLGKAYLDWGELGPGASSALSFYVKSTSSVDVELGLNVTGWTPSGIEPFMSFSWNHNGERLSPQQELLVTVNLSVASSGEFIDYIVENQVQTFSFEMTVYASGS